MREIHTQFRGEVKAQKQEIDRRNLIHSIKIDQSIAFAFKQICFRRNKI